MSTGPIMQRVVFNGIEVPLDDAPGLGDLLPPADLSEEESVRISQLIDALDESDSTHFLLSTSSSTSTTG